MTDYALKNHMTTAGSIVNGLRDACNNLKHQLSRRNYCENQNE